MSYSRISRYVADRLLGDVCESENEEFIDREIERYYQKLLRLLQLMMVNGASRLQYPPIRSSRALALQDMVTIYFGIGDNISIRSNRALVCIFTATFSMITRYSHRLDIARGIASFFADVTRNLPSWNNLLNHMNYDNCL